MILKLWMKYKCFSQPTNLLENDSLVNETKDIVIINN